MSEGREAEQTVLVVDIQSLWYGFDLSVVEKVQRCPRITPVPWLPEYYEGVCSMSGVVMPVVALDRLAGLPGGVRDGQQAVLVVHSKEYECGLLIEESPLMVQIREGDRLEGTDMDVSEHGLVSGESYSVSGHVLMMVDVEETLKNIVVCE